MKGMHWIIYRSLWTLASPLVLAWICVQSWRSAGLSQLRARLGQPVQGSFDAWIHCASVGEVNAATPLVRALHARGLQLLVTTLTPTGLAQAQRRLSDQASLRLLPVDWRWTLRRFMSDLNCPQLLLVETELWPTLITTARKKGMCVRIINGRLSAKTLHSPRWWQAILRDLLQQQVQQVLARNEQDAISFQQLGVTEQQLRVTGNLKLLDTPDQPAQRLHTPPYVLLASSHAPEELTLAHLWQSIPELPTLVIVPRHPNRGNELADALQQQGIAVSQRSRQQPPAPHAVLLADTWGELSHWMAHAELVIMGGSFAPKGGQNPLEAARLGKSILTGPDMRNFHTEVTQLQSRQAIFVCRDWLDLMQQLQWLLANPHERQAMGQRACDWLNEHQQPIMTNTLLGLADTPSGCAKMPIFD